MLLKTIVEKIKTKVVFDERQKHNLNSPINPNPNEEIMM